MHVVFGAGQVGGPLVQSLRSRGLRVRVARRSAVGVPAGVEAVVADATDAESCVRACAKASVVYHCVGAPYTTTAWRATFPLVQENLVRAASRAGARLVVLDNLYALGRPNGRLDETSPLAPLSDKGRLRAELFAALMEAHSKGVVKVAVGRSSHFFGPGVTQSQLGEHLYTRVMSGRSAQLFGNPETHHSFSYVNDVAEGLALLGTADESVVGQAHVLPVMPAVTVRAFIEQLVRLVGKDSKVERVPPLMMHLLGFFMGPVRELIETQYEWDHDYLVDDSRFRARFDFQGTKFDDAMNATAAWVRTAFTKAA